MSAKRLDACQVRRNFSSHAEEYDRYAVVQKRVVDKLLGLLFEDEVEGPVLDVGTGTGMLAASLLDRAPGLPVVLCDAAHGMTRHAASILPGAFAVDADAQALPLASSCLRLVLSSSVYQWMNDLPLAFSESARVLESGGRFAFALFGERTLKELKESHRLALEGGSSHFQEFPTEKEARAALFSAGFSHIRIFSEDEVEYHRDVPALLRSLKKIGAGNASSGRPGGLASRRVMTRMAAVYEERYRRQLGIPATYQVVYGLARKPL